VLDSFDRAEILDLMVFIQSEASSDKEQMSQSSPHQRLA
jgi:hypothetical protein